MDSVRIKILHLVKLSVRLTGFPGEVISSIFLPFAKLYLNQPRLIWLVAKLTGRTEPFFSASHVSPFQHMLSSYLVILVTFATIKADMLALLLLASMAILNMLLLYSRLSSLKILEARFLPNLSASFQAVQLYFAILPLKLSMMILAFFVSYLMTLLLPNLIILPSPGSFDTSMVLQVISARLLVAFLSWNSESTKAKRKFVYGGFLPAFWFPIVNGMGLVLARCCHSALWLKLIPTSMHYIVLSPIYMLSAGFLEAIFFDPHYANVHKLLHFKAYHTLHWPHHLQNAPDWADAGGEGPSEAWFVSLVPLRLVFLPAFFLTLWDWYTDIRYHDMCHENQLALTVDHPENQSLQIFDNSLNCHVYHHLTDMFFKGDEFTYDLERTRMGSLAEYWNAKRISSSELHLFWSTNMSFQHVMGQKMKMK